MVPFDLNYLFKGPAPNTVTLGIGFQQMSLGEKSVISGNKGPSSLQILLLSLSLSI